MLLNFVFDDKDEYIEAKDNETLGEIFIRLCKQMKVDKNNYVIDNMPEKLCETDLTPDTKIPIFETEKRRLWRLLREKYEDFPTYNAKIKEESKYLRDNFEPNDAQNLCGLFCLIRGSTDCLGHFFCTAINDCREDIANVALSFDINVNKTYRIEENYYASPLDMAVWYGNMTIVRALLNKGVEIERSNYRTLRMFARCYKFGQFGIIAFIARKI